MATSIRWRPHSDLSAIIVPRREGVQDGRQNGAPVREALRLPGVSRM